MTTRRRRAQLWCERVAWRSHKLTHPYEQLPFRRGSGAWGRITKRDRRKRAAMFAEMERRIAAGEYKPRRVLRDEDGRFVRLIEETE